VFDLNTNAVKREKYCTYEDWLAIDDGNRYELLNGELYMMSAPATQHQAILMEISRQLANFLLDKPCNVYPAPFGVHLNKDTVFQPDIVVVCDPDKINEKGCEGAPDFVVEILSPSTANYDCIVKYKEYLHAGVKEYWIVDPTNKTVFVNFLKGSEYVLETYSDANNIPVNVLPELAIDMKLAFKGL